MCESFSSDVGMFNCETHYHLKCLTLILTIHSFIICVTWIHPCMLTFYLALVYNCMFFSASMRAFVFALLWKFLIFHNKLVELELESINQWHRIQISPRKVHRPEAECPAQRWRFRRRWLHSSAAESSYQLLDRRMRKLVAWTVFE